MAKTQKLREALSGSPSLEYLAQMSASGWKLVALEWERESSEEEIPESSGNVEEVPYGMQVAEDCRHLMESPAEMRVLMSAVNMIVDDFPMSRVAEELNRAGYRTRNGARWTPAGIFDLLPRMIEAGPRIFTREEWIDRRKRLSST